MLKWVIKKHKNFNIYCVVFKKKIKNKKNQCFKKLKKKKKKIAGDIINFRV